MSITLIIRFGSNETSECFGLVSMLLCLLLLWLFSCLWSCLPLLCCYGDTSITMSIILIVCFDFDGKSEWFGLSSMLLCLPSLLSVTQFDLCGKILRATWGWQLMYCHCLFLIVVLFSSPIHFWGLSYNILMLCSSYRNQHCSPHCMFGYI